MMLIIKTLWIILVVFSLNYLVFSPGTVTYASAEKNVLFISSYTESFDSVPYQISGIQSVFKPNDINLDIEYMDTKRFDTDENMRNFYQLIKYKFQKLPPYDAIIVGDDNALEFILKYQKELFNETPIIFLGINDVNRAIIAAKDTNITGVIEAFSLAETIQIAQKFNEKATKVLAIIDDTITGKGDKEQFYQTQKNFKTLSFRDLNASEYTFDELKGVLKKIEKDTILLYLSMFQDKTGAILNINESVKLLVENTRVPVYRASIGGVGQGLLGGKMVSYDEQGRVAANMALKVLTGTPIDTIKIITKSPNKYIFDYQIIEKYNMNKKVIPEDAVLINKRISFYDQNKKVIWIVLLIIGFLLILIIVIMMDNIKRRIIVKELNESHEELEATYEELVASQDELGAQYKTIQQNANKITILNQKYEIAINSTEYLAYHDSLTTLPNRRSFMNKISEQIVSGTPGAILLLDLDNFKGINDTLGHAFGDSILKEIAMRLFTLANEKIFVSRFGGDEFLILICDENNNEGIVRYAQKVIELFTEPFDMKGNKRYFHFSIGIAQFPKDSNDIEELIMYADTAMYKVKNSGKNNYVFFEKEMIEKLKEIVDIEHILVDALKTDGFALVYQPQVHTMTGKITGFEALLRLKEHRISPGKFIPIAEEAGLIVDIGRWVTIEAINQIAIWKEKGFELKPIAINLSSKQLSDENYNDFLKCLLKKKGVEARYLEIEITESILLEESNDTILFLNKIKDIGIKISLDDFGTGYSSFNYLTFLPLDKIKLDKSLIDKFLKPDRIQIMDNIISLAHSLNLEITAEGVEEYEQYRLLKVGGCDYIQGYFFSKPLAAGEIEKIYNTNFLEKISIEGSKY
ncbi:EAL domain-containing protein [Clostridium lacusfryxellense]|nr:EAL domain-containing protein [Clostridium lacusfryxellense]